MKLDITKQQGELVTQLQLFFAWEKGNYERKHALSMHASQRKSTEKTDQHLL